jgi:hypothetical protein
MTLVLHSIVGATINLYTLMHLKNKGLHRNADAMSVASINNNITSDK